MNITHLNKQGRDFLIMLALSASIIAISRMQNEVNKLIRYSEKYSDNLYEYRHVSLPEAISKKVRRVHMFSVFYCTDISKCETGSLIRSVVKHCLDSFFNLIDRILSCVLNSQRIPSSS